MKLIQKETEMHAFAMRPEEGGRAGGDPYDLRHTLRAAMGGAGGRGRHRHRDRGYGSFARGGPGGFPFGGPGGGSWRARKARRGDIRSAALLLLFEEPRNGYQIMQEVEERSGGLWSPSPGSVYPALQQLEDEGLIRAEEIDGRKLFRLTDSGREQVEKRDPARPAPWDEIGGELGGQRMRLGQALGAVASAAAEIIRTGSDEQMARAQKILGAAKRDLYGVLAEEDSEAAADNPDEER
jgi:DNA-binding PadR family transcriptional regulator